MIVKAPMLKSLSIFSLALGALALAGCDGGHTPSHPSNLVTELRVVHTDPAAASTVTTWRCATGGIFAGADCTPATLHVLAGAAATTPGAPGALSFSVSGSTVLLTWTGATAATSYVVEAGSASGLIDLANFDTGNAAATLTVTGVPAGSYFVRVRAKNSAGSGAASNEVVVVVAGGACTTAPGAPGGLAAVANGTSVTLSWTASTAGCPPTGYVIEAGSTSGLSNLANFNTGSTATSFSTSGVGSGTYFVRVRATNAVGSSAASNEAIFTSSSSPPTPCISPSVPGSLTAAVSGSSVALSWGAASGSPTSYIVDVGTSSGASNVASQNTGSTATSLTSTLSPGTYFARLRSTNACGTSAVSNEVTFTIAAAPCAAPSAPGGLTASASGATVTLSWSAPAGAPTSYRVEVGTTAGSSNVSAADTGSAATSASLTLAAAKYFIRVRAVNGCGTSSASNEVTATTTAPAVPAVITIANGVASPKNLIISQGTQVTFVNNDANVHEMVSDPHPEHTDCPEINQVGFLNPGQSRQTGNLNIVRACGFHDHGNASSTGLQGTITIR